MGWIFAYPHPPFPQRVLITTQVLEGTAPTHFCAIENFLLWVSPASPLSGEVPPLLLGKCLPSFWVSAVISGVSLPWTTAQRSVCTTGQGQRLPAHSLEGISTRDFPLGLLLDQNEFSDSATLET